MTLNMLIGILEQGLIYGIMAMGLLITYRILDFPDLTVDSSFPLGAAVSATLTLQGVAPWLTLLIGCAAGGIAGLITGLIHVKCRVRDLLSGIITMTGLYSINLHIAQNKANLPLFGGDTLFRNAFTKSLPKAISPYTTLIIIFLIVLIAKILLDLFLRTKCGYLLRAAGDNPSVVTTLSRDQGTVKILGLIIANALVALAGAVMCQQQRFFDISMGTGTMVAGLASVIIGTNLFRHASFLRTTTMVLIGSILYKACVSIAISFGLDAQDMKLITAVLFLAILVLSNTRKRRCAFMLEMKNITKIYNPGTVQETCLFRDFSLTINKGSFVSVVGSNGSGKTSMLNLLCGSIPVDAGQILMDGQDITRVKEFRRYRRMGRVYQNPAMGTCGTMTILQNLSMADNKGKPFGLTPGTNRKKIEAYRAMLAPLGLGLEDKMDVPVGSLSGGQRQTLALLMATMTPIDFLILDEHTAALDPKTAEIVMQLTNKVVQEKHLTTLMVTHNLRHAVEYGDRLLMMHQGHVIMDKAGDEKRALKVDDLLDVFTSISIECGN